MTVATRATRHREGTPPLVEGLAEDPTRSASSSRRASPAKSEKSGTSEEERQEKPVREQLKKTTIDATQEDKVATEKSEDIPKCEPVSGEAVTNKPGSIGRSASRRKRSFDDLENTAETAAKHSRKKSRESDEEDDWVHVEPSPAALATEDAKADAEPGVAAQSDDPEASDAARPGTPAQTNDARTVNGLTATNESPHKKRSREIFSQDAKLAGAAGVEAPNEGVIEDEKLLDSTSEALASPAVTERDAKRIREGTPSTPANEYDKIQPSSGFGNTSAESPFKTLKSPKSPFTQCEPASKAIPASSFASLAASSQSPFGALSPQKPESGFASPMKPDAKPNELGPFGSNLSTSSGFGSSAPVFGGQSGFGSLGNASGGSIFGGKPQLKSFAAESSSADFLGKPSRAFGAPVDEEEEVGPSDDDGVPESNEALEATDKDENFYNYNKDAGTGEEGEKSVFTQRAKLYINVNKQWKERGVGVFKVNVPKHNESGSNNEPGSAKPPRFVMRVDGSHRLILNSPIKKEITIRDPSGGPPKGKTALFLGYVDDQPTLCQLKASIYSMTSLRVADSTIGANERHVGGIASRRGLIATGYANGKANPELGPSDLSKFWKNE